MPRFDTVAVGFYDLEDEGIFVVDSGVIFTMPVGLLSSIGTACGGLALADSLAGGPWRLKALLSCHQGGPQGAGGPEAGEAPHARGLAGEGVVGRGAWRGR